MGRACRNNHNLVDFTSVEDLLWNISKTAVTSTPRISSVKIAIVKSRQTGFIWRITECSRGGQDASVVEDVNFATAVRVLVACLEAREADCVATSVCLSPSVYHQRVQLIVANIRLDSSRLAPMCRRRIPPVLGKTRLATPRSMVTTDLAARQLR